MSVRWLLLLLPCACAVDEDRFDDAFAERFCAATKACDEDAFFRTWKLGTDQCRTDIADDVDDQRFGNGSTSACTYVEEAAEAALADVRSASCDDLAVPGYVDRTADAWDCVAILDPGAP